MLLSCLSCVLLLSGCGGDSLEDKTISFDGFSVDISGDFTTINKGLVENKQLINKILYSAKIDSNEWFDTNFIVTASLLPPTLDYEQFRTVNTNKLKQYVQWYIPGEKEIIEIACNGQTIKWIYVSFSVQDTLLQTNAIYYMTQLQFVANDTWYILSYATNNEDDRDALEKRMKNITC